MTQVGARRGHSLEAHCFIWLNPCGALTLVIQTALDSFDYFFFKFFCWRFGLAALGDDAWPDKKDGDKGGDNPNESPKERAHRILKENADLEKGPLSPGHREYGNAQKDW